jgi:hypothetical protein
MPVIRNNGRPAVAVVGLACAAGALAAPLPLCALISLFMVASRHTAARFAFLFMCKDKARVVLLTD